MDRTSQAEETVRRYSDMVYRLAFARTGNTADAEDVYQEVFLRYLRSDPQFTSEEHRKAWLLKVTVNCSKSLLTSSWFRRTEPLDEDIPVENPELLEVYPAVQSLPVKYRTVVHLYYFEDLSVKQIASILDIGESSVKTQLHRARAMLRERLQGEYDEL